MGGTILLFWPKSGVIKVYFLQGEKPLPFTIRFEVRSRRTRANESTILLPNVVEAGFFHKYMVIKKRV